MRIGVDARCLEWSRGGVSRYLINMLLLWPEITVNHKFIIYFQNEIPDDDFLKNKIYECKIINGPRILRSRRILTEQLLMPLQLKRDKLNVFFATWYSAPLLLRNTDIIVAAWDISYSTHPSHYSLLNQFSLGYFSRKSCERAIGVITCSHFDAKQIENYYKVPSSKILTVHLSADDRFSQNISQEILAKVRIKYKLPDLFILSLGVIHNRRNVDVIIKAFLEIKCDYPEYSLVIVGHNKTRPHIDIERMLEQLICERRAIYIPWFEDDELPSLYKLAHSYICTSTVDGETIMLKEAMKVGTPVITSPLLRDSIGNIGIIINNPESVSDTAVALRSALGKNTEREKLIKRGIAWNNQFNWKDTAQKSLEFIELSVCEANFKLGDR